LHGVQGVECSNHSVPTKNSLQIKDLKLKGFESFFVFIFRGDFTPLFTPPIFLDLDSEETITACFSAELEESDPALFLTTLADMVKARVMI